MAQKTITQLPSAGFPGGADLVEIVQNGGSYKLSLQAIKNFVLQSSSSSSVSSSSSSLSSSSQSSSSSDSQSSSSQSGPGWLTVCDDADWMVSGGEGAWSPSAFGWKSTTGVAPYFLQLVPKNGWEVGFRPSTLRVGYVPSGGVNMELAVSSDVSPSGIALDLNYISDSEIPLTFASPSAASDDIAVVRFKSDTVFTVPCSATIEFYLGSSSSSSYSSSSSESSSSSSSSSSESSSSSSSSSSESSSSSSSSESSSSSSSSESSSSSSSSESSSSSSSSESSSSSSSSESSSSSSSSSSESSSSSSSSESSSSSSSSTSESSSSSSLSSSSSESSSSSSSSTSSSTSYSSSSETAQWVEKTDDTYWTAWTSGTVWVPSAGAWTDNGGLYPAVGLSPIGGWEVGKRWPKLRVGFTAPVPSGITPSGSVVFQVEDQYGTVPDGWGYIYGNRTYLSGATAFIASGGVPSGSWGTPASASPSGDMEDIYLWLSAGGVYPGIDPDKTFRVNKVEFWESLSSSSTSSSSESSSSSSSSESSSSSQLPIWKQRAYLNPSGHNTVLSVTDANGYMLAGTDGFNDAAIYGSPNGIDWELKHDFSVEGEVDGVPAMTYDSIYDRAIAGTWYGSDGGGRIYAASGATRDDWVEIADINTLSSGAVSSILSLLYVASGASPGDGTLIAGTGDQAEIWISRDGGDTWTEKADIAGEFRVRSLAYDSLRNRVLAGTSNGGDIYASSDYGDTWSLLADNPFSPCRAPESMTYDAVHDAVLCGTGFNCTAQVWKSTDGGATWTSKKTFTGVDYVQSLHYHPSGSYFPSGATFIGLNESNEGEIWTTTDGGETFSRELEAVPATAQNIVYDLDYSPANLKMLAGIKYGGRIFTRNDYWPSSSSESSTSFSSSSESSSSESSSESSSSSSSTSSSSTSSSSESTFPLELEQLDVDDTNFPSYQGVKADQNFDIRPFAYTGGEYSQGIRTYSVNPSSGILDLVDETPITDGYLRAIYTESPGPSALVYAAGNELYTCSVNTTGGGVLLDSVDSGNNFYDITGEGDGTYLYAACFLYGLVTFGLSGVGIPYEIDRERTGGGSSFRTYGVITGAGFVFTCGRNNLPYGVRSFSVSAGIMTHIDTVETSFNFNGVHYAFGYLFSVGNQGLKSYSVNVSGGLTNIDTDHDGDSDEWVNVWSDERWLYVACGNDRSIRRYSVNVSGGLAMEQYINPGEFNSFKDVHASEGIVYVACAGGGLRTYSMLPQSSSSSSTSSSSESSSSYSSSSSSSSTSFSSSSLSYSSSSSTSVSFSSSSFSMYDYMGSGWPLGRARLQVVIGDAWDSEGAPFEEDDVIELQAVSTGGASNYIYYSEDGTSTGNGSTNRLQIRIGQFTDQRFQIFVASSYSNFKSACLQTDMGVGTKYDFKEFFDGYGDFGTYNSSYISPAGSYLQYQSEVFKSMTYLAP